MKEEKEKLLMIEPGGGLCNRLIAVNNALHLAEIMPDLCICIVWWKEPECGCKFQDILKPIEGIPVKNYSRPLKKRKEFLKEGKIIDACRACFNQMVGLKMYPENR